jgi:hypothetical protein
MAGPVPAQFIFHIIIIIIIERKNKKIQKIPRVISIILYNIGLYIYIVRYKSGIKIPGILQKIS